MLEAVQNLALTSLLSTLLTQRTLQVYARPHRCILTRIRPMSFNASKKNLKNTVVSAPDEHHQRVYEFGPFTIDDSERQLLRQGIRVPVTAKAFDTLLLLVQRNGHLVEKS